MLRNWLKPNNYASFISILLSIFIWVSLCKKKQPHFRNQALLFALNIVAIVVAYIALWSQHFLWSPAAALTSCTSGFVALAFLRHFSEAHRHAKVVKSFAQYLHPDLVRQMSEDFNFKLNGDSRELTLLFADLRNFTSLSEKVSPETLVEIMNQYFSLAVKHIQESKGTVDKFIGDAVMAFWNAPVLEHNHRLLARDAVLRLMDDFEKFSQHVAEKYDMKEPLRIGIGLHTGPAIVGNVGGLGRLNYTALGDSVNTASRLEGVCKVYGLELIVSDSTFEMNEDAASRFSQGWIEVDSITVKGQTKAISIWTHRRDSTSWLASWNSFREAYCAGDFVRAKVFLEQVPSTFPPKEIFQERMAQLGSPPSGWSGTWKLTEK